jgi:hypothetical protein
MSKLSSLCLLRVAAFVFTACNTTPQLDVRDLVKNAPKYNGKIVVVDGCAYSELEMFAVGPCYMPSDTAANLTTYTAIEDESRYLPDALSGLQKRNEKLSDKDRQLEEQLINMPKGVLMKVRLKGEFRFSTVPKFGNKEEYRCELIVHRVLEIRKN